MTTKLLPLFILNLICVAVFAQCNQQLNCQLASETILFFDVEQELEMISSASLKSFSYKKSNEHHHGHTHTSPESESDHSHGLVLIDIISSDEAADVNCSAGFCMEKSHYHKKGLTLRRQLFNYFLEISC